MTREGEGTAYRRPPSERSSLVQASGLQALRAQTGLIRLSECTNSCPGREGAGRNPQMAQTDEVLLWKVFEFIYYELSPRCTLRISGRLRIRHLDWIN